MLWAQSLLWARPCLGRRLVLEGRERFASPGPQEAVWAKRSLPAASSLWPDLCVARPDPKDLLPGRASASRP